MHESKNARSVCSTDAAIRGAVLFVGDRLSCVFAGMRISGSRSKSKSAE